VGPTLIFSVTVVAGRLFASFEGTNLPVLASRTLVLVLAIFLKLKVKNLETHLVLLQSTI